MQKHTNVICLVIWIISLIYGIVCAVNGTRITPVSYVFATMICVLHYVEELLDEK
jgi:hypothetical protein